MLHSSPQATAAAEMGLSDQSLSNIDTVLLAAYAAGQLSLRAIVGVCGGRKRALVLSFLLSGILEGILDGILLNGTVHWMAYLDACQLRQNVYHHPFKQAPPPSPLAAQPPPTT